MRCLLYVLLAAGVSTTAAEAQQIRARVVDQENRQAVADATALLLHEGATVATASADRAGFFRLQAPGAGTFAIVVQQIGFAESRREVEVADADLVVPARRVTCIESSRVRRSDTPVPRTGAVRQRIPQPPSLTGSLPRTASARIPRRATILEPDVTIR